MREREQAEALRARGLRMTSQRRSILAALRGLGHATPDTLAAAVSAGGGGPMALSTVYRTLETLTRAGVVAHTHLDHGAPSYHLVEHGHHLHLVCTVCGGVTEADPAAAAQLAGNLRERHGFTADVTHMAIHGRCRQCADAATDPGGTA